MADNSDAERRIQAEPPARRPLELDEDYSLPRGDLAADSWQPRLALSVVGTLINLAVLLGLGFFIATLSLGFSLLLLLLQILLYGWLLYAYAIYRQGRQEELLLVLTTAIDSGAPLPEALRAYMQDRPHGGFREFLIAAALCLLLPGYYWIWYYWYNYDRLVERLAFLLEQGKPLNQALLELPGLAGRETILAAAVGEHTGKMALCLRHASRRKLTKLWGEVIPRFLYPLGMFLFISLVVNFWMIYLLPKMEKIFKDFKQFNPTVELPNETTWLVHHWPLINLWVWLTLVGGLFLFVLQLSLTTVRWYFPVLGWFYRKDTQSRVLQMLGVLLETDKPIPEALTMLSKSGYFQGIAVNRLDEAARDVSGGQPLADSLTRAGLLPGSMTPLVRAAERMRNLPRTLAELGEHLLNRMARLLRWTSLVLFPLSVGLIGWLVYSVALALFVPLMTLMDDLMKLKDGVSQ
jgi:type II secretory pathway component PulF